MGQIGAWLSNSAAAFFLPGEGRRRDRHISWAIRGEKRHVPILHPKPLLSPRALSWRKGEPEGLRAHEHYSALQLQRLWPCTAPPQPAAPLGNLSGRNQCCVQSNLDHFISHVSEAGLGLITASPGISRAPSVTPFLTAFTLSKAGEGRKEGEKGSFLQSFHKHCLMSAEPGLVHSSGDTEYNQI